jgi:hypothetical protein
VVDSPLLRYLLDSAENARGTDPIGECVSRDSSAKAVGEVPSGWAKKAATGEQGLGDQLVSENSVVVSRCHSRHRVGAAILAAF